MTKQCRMLPASASCIPPLLLFEIQRDIGVTQFRVPLKPNLINIRSCLYAYKEKHAICKIPMTHPPEKHRLIREQNPQVHSFSQRVNEPASKKLKKERIQGFRKKRVLEEKRGKVKKKAFNQKGFRVSEEKMGKAKNLCRQKGIGSVNFTKINNTKVKCEKKEN